MSFGKMSPSRMGQRSLRYAIVGIILSRTKLPVELSMQKIHMNTRVAGSELWYSPCSGHRKALAMSPANVPSASTNGARKSA